MKAIVKGSCMKYSIALASVLLVSGCAETFDISGEIAQAKTMTMEDCKKTPSWMKNKYQTRHCNTLRNRELRALDEEAKQHFAQVFEEHETNMREIREGWYANVSEKMASQGKSQEEIDAHIKKLKALDDTAAVLFIENSGYRHTKEVIVTQ